MKVLHVMKTASGGDWAARQVAELMKLGVETHVALPEGSSGDLQKWKDTGALLHFAHLDLPTHTPWNFFTRISAARDLVAEINPDLIHSHFFGTTVTLRLALGKTHPIPRIFQVPGPLHLEHRTFRTMDLASAGTSDHWIASSEYIRGLYLKAGVEEKRVFKSYYGLCLPTRVPIRTHALHKLLDISSDQKIIGNVSYIYKPKYFLGQWRGIKRHEDLIDALAAVTRARPDVTGVLIGGAWKDAENYEKTLRKRAKRIAGERIRLLGTLPSQSIPELWADFDLAVHVPDSENCGGVAEPLLAGVPVIASRVGGLPEVIVDGLTGSLVPPRDPAQLAEAILKTIERLPEARVKARAGQERVRQMFDVLQTAREVLRIYETILNRPGSRRS